VHDLQEIAVKYAGTWSVEPATGTIGVEVKDGVSLASATTSDINAIKQLVSHSCVAVFRNQHMPPATMVNFAAQMAKVSYTPGLEQNTQWHDVYRIDNPGKANARTENWHTDASFALTPAAYSVLAAAEIPKAGGDTMFLNQYISYSTLSDSYKRMLRGLRLRHVGVGQGPAGSKDHEWPQQFHPIVRIHPETQRRALFINIPRLHREIEGFTEAESKPLIDFLYAHSQGIDRMYRHRWRTGDVVIWDNRCALHAAPHDYGDQTRTLYRVITEGEIPSDGPYSS
jgi:taurine dioxygenase